MFGGLDLTKVLVLLLFGLFIFGPERLPGMVEQAAQALQQLRRWLKAATQDLKSELGPELGDLDFRSLQPKTFIRKHLLEDPTESEPTLAGREPSALLPGEAPPIDPETT